MIEAFLMKLIDTAIDAAKEVVIARVKQGRRDPASQPTQTKRVAPIADLAGALARHVELIRGWATNVSFLDLRGSKRLLISDMPQ